MGKRLVLFRSIQQQVAALEDRCRHRNTALSEGLVCDDTLQCPYHGWRYGLDGHLVEVPALTEKTSLPREADVRTYPCVEQDGYIWVSLLDNPVESTPLGLPHLGDAGWTSFHMQTRFNAPIEACLENFLDCPHATYVHKRWFRSPTDKIVGATVRSREDGAEVEYFHEPREKSLVWWLLSPRNTQMKHIDRFIAPNISRVDYEFSNGFHYIITSVCTPIDNQVTEAHTTITFKFGRIGWLIRLFFEPLSKIIIRQDVDMLNAVQQNINGFGEADFTMTEADLLAPHIIEWRKAIKNKTALPLAGRKQEFDIRL